MVLDCYRLRPRQDSRCEADKQQVAANRAHQCDRRLRWQRMAEHSGDDPIRRGGRPRRRHLTERVAARLLFTTGGAEHAGENSRARRIGGPVAMREHRLVGSDGGRG